MTLLSCHQHINIFKQKKWKKDKLVHILKLKGPIWKNKMIKDLSITNK